jgi:hypothetical protein
MNRDDIIRMAREAGFEVMDEGKHHYAHITDTLCHIDVAVERFAALVAAAEREACASLEIKVVVPTKTYSSMTSLDCYEAALIDTAIAFRETIRARGQE